MVAGRTKLGNTTYQAESGVPRSRLPRPQTDSHVPGFGEGTAMGVAS
jgi:hypothetical protein